MDVWLIVGMALVTGVSVGYAARLHIAARVRPSPLTVAPTPPSFAVSLCYPDGTLRALTVPRRTYRLFYDGCAWEHAHTSSGAWIYVPVDGETPRHTQQRAMTDG